MALYKLLLYEPLLACSVCMCLLAIAAAIRLVRKLSHGSERFIAGFVGLVAIYEAFKILMQVGIWTQADARGWTDFATLTVTGMFVLVLIVVQELGSEGRRTRCILRLLEAIPNASPTCAKHLEQESSAVETTTTPSSTEKKRILITGAA